MIEEKLLRSVSICRMAKAGLLRLNLEDQKNFESEKRTAAGGSFLEDEIIGMVPFGDWYIFPVW